jgi:hypothetical protein
MLDSVDSAKESESMRRDWVTEPRFGHLMAPGATNGKTLLVVP